MIRFLTAVVLALAATVAAADAPQPGLWWNPYESGRGYAIDSQGGILVLTVFAYGYDGRMQWYYADGPLTADGTRWSGTLLKFDDGQPLNGGYRPPMASGSDGPVSIAFSSRTTGTITLPGGYSVPIQRQNFGVGDPPYALLGQWLFAYSIGGSTYGDRYNYTRIVDRTTDGNGVVVDPDRRAAAEYQLSGSLAGRVIGFRFSSTGAVLDQYLWTLQLEEGRGSWVSPRTFMQYGMNVYKTATPAGVPKASSRREMAADEGKGAIAEPEGISLEALEARDPALGTLARRVWESMARADFERSRP